MVGIMQKSAGDFMENAAASAEDGLDFALDLPPAQKLSPGQKDKIKTLIPAAKNLLPEFLKKPQPQTAPQTESEASTPASSVLQVSEAEDQAENQKTALDSPAIQK